jgi:multiple sugar transport system ATP-binding protein
MDEPLSNLDAKLRVQMRAEIARLQRDLGVTTVYVTHDQVEAMTMGDRVAVLKDGYLQQVDSPQNLYDKPDNVFVAAFIGSPSMNLHEATLSGSNLTLGSHTIALPDSVFEKRPGLKAFDGKSVIVGFRPEDLEDSALAPDEKKGATFSTQVTLTEALGSEIIVHFELDAPKVDAGDPDAVDDLGESTAVGRFDPRSRAMMGDTIEIAINTINLHFFDPEARTAVW